MSVHTSPEVAVEAEGAEDRAARLRAEADQVEAQAFLKAAELRAEADAIDMSTWPRMTVLTKANDPELVARIEALAVEAGAVVVGHRDAVVYVNAKGQPVVESPLPVEDLGLEVRPVYELTVAGPSYDPVLGDVAARARDLGLAW